jgi:hypothetical protein
LFIPNLQRLRADTVQDGQESRLEGVAKRHPSDAFNKEEALALLIMATGRKSFSEVY